MESIGKNDIEHLGRVIAVDKEKITVAIIANTACVSCSVKGSCSVGEVEEKIVEVANEGDRETKTGDVVTVVLDMKSGAKAVMLGYVFPFLVLLLTLIVLLSAGFGEGTAGLGAILMLVPYYLILYVSGKRRKRHFGFKIK